MRIAVFYNDPSEDAAIDADDVLVQLKAVADALGRLGHEPVELACTLDLAAAQKRLEAIRPDVVFNLVESLGGTDRLMMLATLLLDAMHLPYTGANTEAIFFSSNKLLAKQRLRGAELPTPLWLPADGHSAAIDWPRRFIVKLVHEHASLGIDDAAVVDAADLAELQAALDRRSAATKRPCFAEGFVDGREFNLSLLAGASSAADPQVLPAAEIDFSAFPRDKPRIVGHAAKWDRHSFEYHQTPRRFDFTPSDATLLQQLSDLAQSCWRLFGLRGYARVDFRVDPSGQPWILEINANPCLAPDAGFAAALQQAGIAFEVAIQRIVTASSAAACDDTGGGAARAPRIR